MDSRYELRYSDSTIGIGRLVLTAGAALLLGACASTPPPIAQLAVAKSAVSDAESAGGTAHAPVEMKAARDKLEAANAAMTSEHYEQARTLAEASQVDAQLAEAKAHASKARTAADAVREDSRVLREELNRKTR